MMVRFFSFEAFHGKSGIGSTFIRVHQLIDNWHKVYPDDDVGLYRYGERPDALIFQKVYCLPDYKFPAHFPGIKILDAADPDYLDGVMNFAETVEAMDGITCSSDNLTDFIKQLTDNPVITVKDRFNIETLPKPKKHSGDARIVAWFGYRHNAELLKPAMKTLAELNVRLMVICEDDPFAWQWLPRGQGEVFKHSNYLYVKYREQSFYQDLQRADLVLLPKGSRPVDHFKSDNKTTKSILAGLPVAKNGQELKDFMNGDNRSKWMEANYEKTKKEYDVLNSIRELKSFISELK